MTLLTRLVIGLPGEAPAVVVRHPGLRTIVQLLDPARGGEASARVADGAAEDVSAAAEAAAGGALEVSDGENGSDAGMNTPVYMRSGTCKEAIARMDPVRAYEQDSAKIRLSVREVATLDNGRRWCSCCPFLVPRGASYCDAHSHVTIRTIRTHHDQKVVPLPTNIRHRMCLYLGAVCMG